MDLKVKTMSDWKNEGENPEILFWVGSAGSFDDRAKKITRAFVKIMHKAQVEFGVLGTEEDIELLKLMGKPQNFKANFTVGDFVVGPRLKYGARAIGYISKADENDIFVSCPNLL